MLRRLFALAIFVNACRAAGRSDPNGPVAGYVPSLVPAIVVGVMYALSGIVLWIRAWFSFPPNSGVRSCSDVRLCSLYSSLHVVPHDWNDQSVFCSSAAVPKSRLTQEHSSALTIGMALRCYYHFQAESLGVYIIMTLGILLSRASSCPEREEARIANKGKRTACLFLAQSYMLLKRLAISLGDQVAQDTLLISPRRLAKIFVISDCVTFFLQASGGGLSSAASKNPSMANIGDKVTIIALVAQLASYLLFSVILVTFGIKVRSKYPRVWKEGAPDTSFVALLGGFGSVAPRDDWRTLYNTLFVVSIGILVRSAFRVAEYVGGYYSVGPYTFLSRSELTRAQTVPCHP